MPAQAAANALAFVLGNEGQYLQHQVGNEGAHQVAVTAGVQQRHCNDGDVDLQLPGQVAPLLLNFGVVASQPVDALHDEQVTGSQNTNQRKVGPDGRRFDRRWKPGRTHRWRRS